LNFEHVLSALKTVTYGSCAGNGVGGAVDVDVSPAGKRDDAMNAPTFVHETSVPTSGDRKKFCCAMTCCCCEVSPERAPAAK
jgi:hypothetical protein